MVYSCCVDVVFVGFVVLLFVSVTLICFVVPRWLLLCTRFMFRLLLVCALNFFGFYLRVLCGVFYLRTVVALFRGWVLFRVYSFGRGAWGWLRLLVAY